MLSLLRKVNDNRKHRTDTDTASVKDDAPPPAFGSAFAEHVYPLRDWDGLHALLQACLQYPPSLPAHVRWDFIEKAVHTASEEKYTRQDLQFVAERLERRYGTGECVISDLLRVFEGSSTGPQQTSLSVAQAHLLWS